MDVFTPGEFDELMASIAKSNRRKLPILRPAPADCQSCGACCSHYAEVDVHVDDPNFDLLRNGGYLENRVSKHRYSMKVNSRSRCIALTGTVGEHTACSIYENRPEGCRNYERGNPRCRSVVIMDVLKVYG